MAVPVAGVSLNSSLFMSHNYCLSWFLMIVMLGACLPGDKIPSQRIQIENERAYYSFDDSFTSWDTFFTHSQAALFRIKNGVLEGAVIADRGYLWSLDHQYYTNIAVQVTVQQTRGALGNGFGLICRAYEVGNGYYFVISSEGFYNISKATADKNDLVQLIKWQYSPAIHTGEVSNKLLAICVDDYLAFFVNDRFLADTYDIHFSSGQLGVTLGATRETLWVSFDDITIRDATSLGAR